MEGDRVTDELLDLIRKELTSIIDEKQKPPGERKTDDSNNSSRMQNDALKSENKMWVRTTGGNEDLISPTEPLKGETKLLINLSPRNSATSSAGVAEHSAILEKPQVNARSTTPKVTIKAPINATKTSPNAASNKIQKKDATTSAGNASTKTTNKGNIGSILNRRSTAAKVEVKSSIKKPILKNAKENNDQRAMAGVAASNEKLKTKNQNKASNVAQTKPTNIITKKPTAPTDPIKPNASTSNDATTPQTSDNNPYRNFHIGNNRTFDFLESHACTSIDEDLQRMQVDLKKSYELFQSIGEKFESINFNNIQNRIRDLHLNASNDWVNSVSGDLRKLFEKRYMENKMNNLTAEVGAGFRRHPGEFADIPELSAFFQACTQLEHGLHNLKNQRQKSNEIEKRMCWATEIAYDRMDEIRNSVGTSPNKNF